MTRRRRTAQSRRWRSSGLPAPSARSCSTCCRPGRTCGARSGWSRRPAPPAAGCAFAARIVEVLALAPEVFDGVDVAMFDVPDEVSARVGARRRRSWSRRRRQLRRVPDGPRRASRRARGQCRRRAGPAQGHHQQPELHDAVDDRRRRCAAPGVRRCASSSWRRTRRRPAPGRPGSTRLRAQMAKVGGDPSLGSRAGDVRAVVGDDLGRSRRRWP